MLASNISRRPLPIGIFCRSLAIIVAIFSRFSFFALVITETSIGIAICDTPVFRDLNHFG
jgi:hypothetical protein